MKIAIMSAMREELNRVIKGIENPVKTCIANRAFYQGTFEGNEIIAVFSHWGKVAAALTTTLLINEFKAEKIIFTGVAGGLSANLHIGDIVIGHNLFQHDMDSSPMIPRYEIPLLKRKNIETIEAEVTQAFEAATQFVNNIRTYISADELAMFSISTPKVVIGDIASGDEFVSEDSTRERILNDLPSVICVEMEGAAVAQVCNDFHIPFVVIRTISDGANSQSHIDFPLFIENVASIYSENIIRKLL